MIDLAPRPCDVGPKRSLLGLAQGLQHGLQGLGKRKLYAPDADVGGPCKRRGRVAVPAAVSAGARLVDLQILGEDGALVQEATIEEIWAPHATRLEIVVVDEAWDAAASLSSSTASASPASSDATFIDLDDPVAPLGPLGGTSTLHEAILREAQQHHQQHQQSAATARAVADCETADSDFGNLDWLINFKVDSVFEPKKHRARPAGALTAKEASSASALGKALARTG